MRTVPIQPTKDEARRFWELVERGKPGECWGWVGNMTPRNYGMFTLGGRSMQAHRISYTLMRGAIPDGLVIDHLCANHACVNPAHLEPVTPEENNRRAIANGQIQRPNPVSWRRKQRYCKRGHELTDENVYVFPSSGVRRCRKCLAAAQQRAYQARKARKATA